MNIEFIKIEIQNFKSVGELITFNYQDLKGLNFVYGKNIDVPSAKNGSGKSVIVCDALSFALFGKTLKNTNNKYLPNRFINEKLKPYVKVYLRSNGQLYSCETYGRVAGGIMSSIGIEILKLNDDYSIAEDLTQSSVIKSKQYIQDNILGCSFDIFKSSIMVSSADFMNFYEGMGKDAKRKYIENIFNLNCFGNMFLMIKSDINDTKKELSSTKNEILKLVDSIKNITEKYNNFDESIQKKRLVIKQQLLDKSNELNSVKKSYSEISFKSTDDLEQNKLKLKDEITKLDKAWNDLRVYKIKKETEVKHINSMIIEVQRLSEGLCEKCIKLINSRYDYDNKKKEIEDINVVIEQIIQKIEKVNKVKDIKNNELIEINNKIKENDSLKNTKNKLELNIKFIESEINSLKKSYNEVKPGTVNPFESLLTESKNNLLQLKEQLVIFNKNIQHLEILRDACSENGIKKFIIKDIVKLLNSLIQKYLNEIGCEFIVYFDETFEFKFLTSTGECEFSSFSAGERQRIQIATILAFRDLILNDKISSNIFIIDELLDANVDTICIENVMKILKRKSLESHQNIFIISHRSELADNESIWDNIIKITKESGKSTYEVK